jgi:ABC-2 type transport system ATP-binding protein
LLAGHLISRFYLGGQVVLGMDLDLHRGDVLVFLVPNGAGKSNTLNFLWGVIAPHGGNIRICGYDLATVAGAAKRHLGYLPEVPPLYADATVDEYLLYSAQLRALPADKARAAVAKAKRDCDLDEVGGRLIGNLSKGFRQRVGIAQALLHEPAVVILDEPTSGLDPNQIRTVRDTIRELAQHHAVVLSTHVLSEAQALCNRVIILHRGRIAFDQAIDHSRDCMIVRLAERGNTPAWALLDGVIESESIAPDRYRLHVSDYDRAAEAVCRHAVEQGWGLRELARDVSPLVQVFVVITCNDDTPAA